MPALHLETSRTRIGVQSAIGTAAGTMKELVVYGDQTAIVGKARQNTAPNLNQTRRRREYHASIKLQKSGSPVQLQTYVRALSTALASGTSPVAFSHASAISHQILYRAIFGAELAPSQGSTVASSSGTPVDTIEVATGHGSRFTVGSIIKITRSAAAPWVRRVTAVSTDTLTVYPPLDDSPAVSAVIHNLYNYFTGETDSTTYTIEHTAVEGGTAESQVRALGVHGGGQLSLTINEVASVVFDGMSLSHTDPSDLSISDDPAADDVGAPMVWQPVIWWGMSAGAAPSVAELSKAVLTVPRKWQMVPGAVVEGVGSVHEVAGKGEPITIECGGLFDSDAWADFAADTEKGFVAYTVVGTGTSARVAGFWCPRTLVEASPQTTAMDSLIARDFTLKALMATDIAGSAPALSVAQIQTANVIWFWG